MNQTWNRIYLENTVEHWTIALIIVVAGIILISIVKRIILRRLQLWSKKTTTGIDDFIVATVEKSVVPLLYIACFYFALNTLVLNATVHKVLKVVFLLAATFFVLQIITVAIKQLVFSFIQKQENADIKEKQAGGLLIIVNVVIWVLGMVFIIDNLGYNVTTLVAGLGIGGIAIALAAQTILGDLFSYFVIFFDRPFEIGDFIVVGDKSGVVEYVGIKTTRIRTLSGEQLICSNTDLTNARVHNYKRMEQRRVVFSIGITYQTPREKLKKIPTLVKEIIQSKEKVRIDRGHFSGFGDFSLKFEFVYYIESPDYNLYMDKQQEIYFEIAAAFEQEGIEFAYPTQTILMEPALPASNNLTPPEG